MLSYEERKAIERLNIYKEKIKDELYPIIDFEEEKAIGVVLNLIKKQSKEIEELSDKLTQKICKGVEEEILEEYRQTIISKNKEIEELKEKYSKKLIEFQKEREWYEKNHISNDKIKAKIEEVKDGTFDAKIVLQSLLEKE